MDVSLVRIYQKSTLVPSEPVVHLHIHNESQKHTFSTLSPLYIESKFQTETT